MQASQTITRKSASNLAMAFVLLPKDKRDGMSALYAFCREFDDIADDESVPVRARAEKLGQWRDNAVECYGQGRRTVHDVVCASQHFVRERPFKALLIATGVGVIAAGGVLLGRLSMRRIREQPLKSVLIAAGGGFLIGRLWMRR